MIKWVDEDERTKMHLKTKKKIAFTSIVGKEGLSFEVAASIH